MFKRILVPVDLNETNLAYSAIEEAVGLGELSGAKLKLVNVQPFLPAAYADYVPPNMGDSLRQAAEQEIGEMAGGINYPQESVSSGLRFGVIYQEVLSEAIEWGRFDRPGLPPAGDGLIFNRV